MRVDVLTIFPQLFEPFSTLGIVERARRAGVLSVHTTDLRDFTNDRHRSVDDRPYGGGPGMLIKPEPVQRAVDLLLGDQLIGNVEHSDCRPLVMCPQGERVTQSRLQEWAGAERLVILCGRYEGFDERILESTPWERVSMGDYVLSGGEIPAMAVIEGVARLIPGALGHPESTERDSFSAWAGEDGYDHPHFTRPVEYRGRTVPEVLRSGDHGMIEAWRRERAAEATKRAGRKAP